MRACVSICVCVRVLLHVESRGQPEVTGVDVVSLVSSKPCFLTQDDQRLGWLAIKPRKNLPICTSLALGLLVYTTGLERRSVGKGAYSQA